MTTASTIGEGQSVKRAKAMATVDKPEGVTVADRATSERLP
jgi:hypothetical protein